MHRINYKKYLIAPPYCEDVKTFIVPITRAKYEVCRGLKIANGWRFFENLRIIQKKNNHYVEVLMSTMEFVKLAKIESKKSLRKADIAIDNITRKRPNFANIEMSRPHIMGVLNLTPDSFYKKSQENNPDSIIKKSKKMLYNGATIIDLGGESTRPGAKKILENLEQKRVIEIIRRMKKEKFKSIISLDTRNLNTMKIGYDSGIDIINDINGLENDEKIKFIISNNLPVIIMHMQNQPQNMQNNPKYNFAPTDIYNFFSNKINKLLNMGMDISNIVVDPGIGFGKNKIHNLDILRNLSIFHCLGVPILVGISRKSLIENLTIDDFKSRGINKKSLNPSKRLSGSIAFAMHAFNSGIQIVRTHDVFETKQALACQFSLN